MKNNPFATDIFTSIWLKHFNQGKTAIAFDCIPDLRFVKHRFLPIFFNVGKKHTKGISYTIDGPDNRGLKGKVFLIYDVPTYFELTPEFKPKFLKLHKIKQYPGFLIGLESFKSISEYINITFKGKSRNKLKRDKKRLENCFDVRYQMYYGNTSKEEYDTIFESFKILLEKRFDKKGIYNNNLDSEEWNFYHEVAYPMIQEKKACLFVVWEGEKPISLMLNFLSKDRLYQFMMAFDIDYAKFNVGTTSLMKLLEWCLEKELKVLDFSKGYFHFKKRWGNLEYRYEYHVLYDSKSFQSIIIAFYLKHYFMLKQILRELKINELLHTFTFRSKNKKTINPVRYAFLEADSSYENISLKLIDFRRKEQQFLCPMVFDFLYYNSESLKNIEVYKILDDTSRYLVVGKNKRQIIQME